MSTSSTFDSNAVTVTINPEAFAPLVTVAVDAAIRRIRSEQPADEEGRILLSKRQAAKALGMSEATVDRLRKETGLPCVKLEGRVLFRPESLGRWVEEKERTGE